MLGIENYILFLGAGILLNVTPGPDMLYVATQSTCRGRSAGVLSALSISCGGLVHTAAAALGLSTVLLVSSTAYEVVRLAGAAYLVWVGLRILLARPEADQGQAPACVSRSRIFRQGFTVSVLNPKVALFFLAFLPQFADHASPHFAAQIAVLGLTFCTTGCLVMLGVALCFGRVGAWASGRPGLRRARNWVTGGVFLTMGLGLGLAGGRD